MVYLTSSPSLNILTFNIWQVCYHPSHHPPVSFVDLRLSGYWAKVQLEFVFYKWLQYNHPQCTKTYLCCQKPASNYPVMFLSHVSLFYVLFLQIAGQLCLYMNKWHHVHFLNIMLYAVYIKDSQIQYLVTILATKIRFNIRMSLMGEIQMSIGVHQKNPREPHIDWYRMLT